MLTAAAITAGALLALTTLRIMRPHARPYPPVVELATHRTFRPIPLGPRRTHPLPRPRTHSLTPTTARPALAPSAPAAPAGPGATTVPDRGALSRHSPYANTRIKNAVISLPDDDDDRDIPFRSTGHAEARTFDYDTTGAPQPAGAPMRLQATGPYSPLSRPA